MSLSRGLRFTSKPTGPSHMELSSSERYTAAALFTLALHSTQVLLILPPPRPGWILLVYKAMHKSA